MRLHLGVQDMTFRHLNFDLLCHVNLTTSCQVMFLWIQSVIKLMDQELKSEEMSKILEKCA